MIKTITKLHSRPEKRKEIAQTVKEIAYQLNMNTKCRHVVICWDINEEDTYTLVEDWSSEHDLDEYRSSRLFSVLLGIRSLLAYPIEFETQSEQERSLQTH